MAPRKKLPVVKKPLTDAEWFAVFLQGLLGLMVTHHDPKTGRYGYKMHYIFEMTSEVHDMLTKRMAKYEDKPKRRKTKKLSPKS